jgi:hypothetical protein
VPGDVNCNKDDVAPTRYLDRESGVDAFAYIHCLANEPELPAHNSSFMPVLVTLLRS